MAWGAQPAKPSPAAGAGMQPVRGADIWLPTEESAPARKSAADTTLLILALLTILVTLGLWGQSPGLAILFFLIIGVPFLITALKALARGGPPGIEPAPHGLSATTRPPAATAPAPLTGAQQAGTFLKWFGIMATSVIAAAGVAIVAVAVISVIAVMSLIAAIGQICGIK